MIEAARGAFGSDMAAFLCWLGVRLMEMRRVLRDDGSIYLHIDHTAHAYVKALMDGIFGRSNFRNEIVWAYTGPSNTKRWFPRKHDTILFFTKSDLWSFNGDDVRTSYVKRDTGRTSGIFKKRAILSEKGKIPEDWWLEDRDGMTPVGRLKRERTGYPTQKPLALYERIIKASSNQGDLVLDPFAGCATTPVAAERLGRRWVGIDIWDGVHQVVLDRLQAEGLASPVRDPERLLTFGDINYSRTPPTRTDDNEMAAPSFRLRIQRPTEPWQTLTHKQIFALLADAQGTSDGVICAGCGRILEKEFMQLDHITPKSDRGENHILNRILLCGPCNRTKRDNLTLRGLMRQNKKQSVRWMRDEVWASNARDRADVRATWVRDHYDSAEYKLLMQKLLPA